MARNDDAKRETYERGTANVPEATRTAEYPEVAGSVGWQGADLDDEIGKPLDPRRRDDGPVPAPPVSSGGGAMRGLFWLVATIGLVVALVLGARAVGLWPNLQNPFSSKTTDRSQPALLKSIQDLNQFVAAEGNFEVIVDVQNDRKYIPDFLVNERILFIAAGTVEAYVDFANIGQGGIKVPPNDNKSVEITLPAPQLRAPRIDNDRSYVYEEQRGAFNRVADLFKSDPNRLQAVYKKSEEKIAAAAKDAGLTQRAEENTRKMLDSMLRSLGFTTIVVKFPAS
jgi:hypothetical protein